MLKIFWRLALALYLPEIEIKHPDYRIFVITYMDENSRIENGIYQGGIYFLETIFLFCFVFSQL